MEQFLKKVIQNDLGFLETNCLNKLLSGTNSVLLLSMNQMRTHGWIRKCFRTVTERNIAYQINSQNAVQYKLGI